MKRLSIVLVLSLLASSAMAQQFFPTPAGNVIVEGKVLMCGNGGSPVAYVPCSGAYPVPTTLSNTSAAPLYVGITDGTNGPAGVAPANTAVTTAQPALAVSIAPASNGVISPGTAGSPSAQVMSIQGVSGGQPIPVSASPLTSDPCTNNAKSSVPIALASATTTQLVALSGSTVIYVCHFSMTIAPSTTTADSIKFEAGTGSNCGSNTAALTGTYGGGDLTTAAPPVPLNSGDGGFMLLSTPAGYALCALTAGGTVNIQGVLSYVQL